MIVDEIHAVMRESLIGFMQHNPQTKIIGLTATPYHAKLKEHFQGIVNVVTMKELVDTGFLAVPRVRCNRAKHGRRESCCWRMAARKQKSADYRLLVMSLQTIRKL